MKMEQTEHKKNFCTENSDVWESLNKKNAKLNMSRTGKPEVDTSVRIMARLLASQLKNRGSIPRKCKKLFSS
jgi:ribosomal protein S3